MANVVFPDYSSKISFAPDTNFAEGFRSRRISSNAGLFNIRRVGNGKRSCHNAPGIPEATNTDIFTDETDDIRKRGKVRCFPSIHSSHPHLGGLLRKFPAPVGLDLPTLCSYASQDKPLLKAAKNSIATSSGESDREFSQQASEIEIGSRFPPLESKQTCLVGQDQSRPRDAETKTERPGNLCKKYGSVDSLNLYLRQSTLSLTDDSVDVFMPYRHVPNLVESRRRSKTFLQDNERIQMLQPRVKADDVDTERLAAYKVPQGDILAQDFIRP